MSKGVKRMKKNLVILFICFVMIMITPASAVQINMLSGSGKAVNSNINGKYSCPNFETVDLNKNCNTKTITKGVSNVKNHRLNAKAIAHASELLPLMEESYQNNSIDISATREAVRKLESEKLNTTLKLKKIESKLDNFEVSSNNTNNYNSMLKEQNEYLSVKKSLEVTETSIKRMKGILYQKQKHTKNCVGALRQIKKSENIKKAVKIYTKNMECLYVINSNMAAEIQQQKDIILYSNNTINNNTNSTNNSTTNSSEIDTKVTDILKYAGIGTTSVTGGASIASLISIIVYGVTTYKAAAAIEAAGIASIAFETASTTAFTSVRSIWGTSIIYLSSCQ